MQKASAADIADIRAFLIDHVTTSMFPLSNLDRHGVDGTHPRSLKLWLRRAEGQVCDVLAQSREGMVFPQCTGDVWPAVAAILRQTGVKGIFGAADQVAALRQATGLTDPAGLDHIEPQYQLSLEEIIMPPTDHLTLAPLQAAPRDLIHGWRAAFCAESMGFPPDEARIRARDDIAAYLAAGTHRVLMQDGVPVAMTGFNAVLSRIVQVGGVYTPPALRGRGFARAAVALHLVQAGMPMAVLSAANAAAARAYVAIGFRQVGQFAMVAWRDRQVVHG